MKSQLDHLTSDTCNLAQETHQARHAPGPKAEAGSRLDRQQAATQGTAGAMREEGKGEERGKKRRRKKKEKGRKNRQVQAGPRGTIPP